MRWRKLLKMATLRRRYIQITQNMLITLGRHVVIGASHLHCLMLSAIIAWSNVPDSVQSVKARELAAKTKQVYIRHHHRHHRHHHHQQQHYRRRHRRQLIAYTLYLSHSRLYSLSLVLSLSLSLSLSLFFSLSFSLPHSLSHSPPSLSLPLPAPSLSLSPNHPI